MAATTVFVMGASGDLAHKKTYPSLYELFLADLLPPRIAIVGYARSALADDAFRARLRGDLKAGTPEQRDAFLGLCIYRSGSYDNAASLGVVSARGAR
jgi:glucose-6-phosphate 1-dehydrogenase